MHPSENRAVGVNKLFDCLQAAIWKDILKNSKVPMQGRDNLPVFKHVRAWGTEATRDPHFRFAVSKIAGTQFFKSPRDTLQGVAFNLETSQN